MVYGSFWSERNYLNSQILTDFIHSWNCTWSDLLKKATKIDFLLYVYEWIDDWIKRQILKREREREREREEDREGERERERERERWEF